MSPILSTGNPIVQGFAAALPNGTAAQFALTNNGTAAVQTNNSTTGGSTLDLSTECPPGGKVSNPEQGVTVYDYGNDKKCTIRTSDTGYDKSCTEKIDGTQVCITSDGWTIASNYLCNLQHQCGKLVKRPDGVIINFVSQNPPPPGIIIGFTWFDPDTGITFETGEQKRAKTVNSDGDEVDMVISEGSTQQYIAWDHTQQQKQIIHTFSCASNLQIPCAKRLSDFQSSGLYQSCAMQSFTIVCKTPITPKPVAPTIPAFPTQQNPCPVSFDPSEGKPNGKIIFAVCVKEPPKKKCTPAGGIGRTPVAQPQGVSDKFLNFIEAKEGYNTLPGVEHVTLDQYGLYNDIAGHCTSGFGVTVHKPQLAKTTANPQGDKCTAQDKLNYEKQFGTEGQSKQQAEADLQTRIADAVKSVKDNFKDTQLSQEQFDALVDLAFNAGADAVNPKTSTLAKDIKAGSCDSDTIAKDFGMWNKVHDLKTNKIVPSAGLTTRRGEEANMFSNGVYSK
jgi:GH24 family phage-related lysozyme (muramidase)